MNNLRFISQAQQTQTTNWEVALLSKDEVQDTPLYRCTAPGTRTGGTFEMPKVRMGLTTILRKIQVEALTLTNGSCQIILQRGALDLHVKCRACKGCDSLKIWAYELNSAHQKSPFSQRMLKTSAIFTGMCIGGQFPILMLRRSACFISTSAGCCVLCFPGELLFQMTRSKVPAPWWTQCAFKDSWVC